MKFIVRMAVAAILLGAILPHANAQGSAFVYNGRLMVGGQPAGGLYDFNFRIYDSASGGAQQGPSRNLLAVPVTAGVFTVTLDFGAGVFTGPARWLDVSVRTNGPALYTTLSPRTELTPTPYAVFAGGASAAGLRGTLNAASIADGTLTGLKIADGSVQTGDLADGAITSAKIADGTIASADLANGAVTAGKVATDVGVWSKNGANLFYTEGYVGVGVAPSVPLQVDGIVRSTGSGGGNFQAYNPNNGTAHVDLSWLNDQARIRIGGFGAGVPNGLDIQGTSDKSLFRVNQAGNANLLESLAIGTNIFLDNDATGGGAQLNMQNDAGDLTVSIDADEGNGAAAVLLRSSTGINTVYLDADNSGGGYLRLRDNGNENRAIFMSTALGITQTLYNSNRAGVISFDTSRNGGGQIVLENRLGAPTVEIIGYEPDEDPTEGGQVRLLNGEGVETIQIDGDDPFGGGVITVANQTGVVTIELDANHAGGGRVTTQVLEIKGGADLSENFDVESEAPVESGSLVSIDPNNPGKLLVCHKPYDRTVAGVVSGAGGVRPGMLMGQQESIANGRHAVALTGRVYCLADADAAGPIEPGDLLTSSPTAGHAMKVTDYPRASGAVVGKAMTRLEKGKGLVLVLVSLQ